MKKIKLYALIALFGIAGALAGAPQANAASAYDDLYVKTDNVKVNYSSGCTDEDISFNWSQYILESSDTTMVQSFENALDNGYWGVTNVIWKSTNEKKAIVFWSETQNAEINFESNQVVFQATNYPTNVVTYTDIIMDSNCDVSAIGWTGSSEKVGLSFDYDLSPTLYYANYFAYAPVNYPSGYEGEEIPDVAPTPPIENDWTPKIKLITGKNWDITYSDENFFTFDGLPFTCGEEGFAPLIEWKIYNLNDEENPVLIDTLLFSASAENHFTASKIQEDARYRLTGQYTGCDGQTFNDLSTKDFTIRADGSLNPTDYMTVCITDTFPYINFNDCMTELNAGISALSFNTLNWNGLGGDWSFTESCRTLVVLDDWIGAPNQEICPQFSSTVRNIVTPFVTMAIGLLMITFLANRGRNEGV